MKTTTLNIGLYKIGTIFCIEVTDVKNTGDESIENVTVGVTVPDGVTYNSGNFPQGAYDTGSDTWNVGTLLAGADLTSTFCYQVTDSTKGPFSFIFTISSPNSCEGCDDDRQFCVIVQGISCADIADCMLEWPETEQVVYTEGNDTVYARAYVITQAEATVSSQYELTDFPVASTDIIRVEGSVKYDAGATNYVLLAPGNTIDEGATYWELPVGAYGTTFAIRLKVYYKKQAASLT